MTSITPGRYRHYKGNEYSVLGVALHSETLEELVVYRQEYGQHGLWVRPKPMFLETVSVEDQEVPRFQRLDSKPKVGRDNPKSLFHDIPEHLPLEIVQTLISTADVRIERIVSHGHASREGFWYDQDQHEWIMVLKGAARLRFEEDEQTVDMKPGDYLNIPARTKHRVEWTTPDEPTVWLAVHYGDGCNPRGKDPATEAF